MITEYYRMVYNIVIVDYIHMCTIVSWVIIASKTNSFLPKV